MNRNTVLFFLTLNVLALTPKVHPMENQIAPYFFVGSIVVGGCGYGVGYLANRILVSRVRSLFSEELEQLNFINKRERNDRIIQSIIFKHNYNHTSWVNSFFVKKEYKGLPLIEALHILQGYRYKILATLPFTCCSQLYPEARHLLQGLNSLEWVLQNDVNFSNQLYQYNQYQLGLQ